MSHPAPTPKLWLDRYSDLLPVRSRGAFHVVSVLRSGATARTAVVVGARGADAQKVRVALAAVAEAHTRIEHPNIPRLIELGEHEGEAFVELACDAVVDGAEFLRLVGDAGQKLPFAEGDVIFTRFREALQAAHQVTDPATGGPYCIGRIAYGNILLSPNGQLWFVGLGYNFPVFKEDGRLEGTGPVWHAPELHGGDPPTPVGDYVAILMVVRSLMAFSEVSEIVRRFFHVATSPDSLEAFEISRWFDTHLIAQRPEARPSIEEALGKMTRLREILKSHLDSEGLERRVAELIAHAAGEVHEVALGTFVTVAADGAWVEIEGKQRKLGRANQQILRTLLLAHRNEPGSTTSVWRLLEAGWPGEDPLPEAGANRVYVAIGRLRAAGLRQVIERWGEGYRIAPSAPLRVASGWPL